MGLKRCMGHVKKRMQIRVAKRHAAPGLRFIAFSSYPDFSDNARALCDYILKTDDANDYQISWFVEKPETELPEGWEGKVRVYSIVSEEGRYPEETLDAAYKAGIIFYTHGFFLREKDRDKRQLVINLWHGDSLKKRDTKRPPAAYDYMPVTGPLFSKIYEDFFSVSMDKNPALGYPRNDFLKSGSPEGKRYGEKLKNNRDKLIFWMPTYRNNFEHPTKEDAMTRSSALPLLADTGEIKEIDDILGELNESLVIKRHPFQKRYPEESMDLKNVAFIDDEDLRENKAELYALLHEADGLISDYSSVAFDFMLMDKPMAFSLEDYDEYKRVRGFSVENPLEYMAGNYLLTKEDLKEYLKDIANGLDPYRDKRRKLMPLLHIEADSYSKNVWEFTKRMLDEGQS